MAAGPDIDFESDGLLDGLDGLCGGVTAIIDPAVQGGVLSRDLAFDLISMRLAYKALLPLNPTVVHVLRSYVAEHKQAPRPDIWRARDVDLTGIEPPFRPLQPYQGRQR